MTTTDTGPTLRRAATAAGFGLLGMTVLAAWSFSTFNDLVVDADAAKTARNIVDHESRFRALTGGFLIVAVLDVLVAWALYALLTPVGRHTATFCAWLRVTYAAVFAAVLIDLLVAVRLLTDGGSPDAFTARQLEAQALTAVNAFKDGWDAALAIFGLHLLVLGHLVYRSRFIPRTLGVLLMIAGAGYVVDGAGSILFADYDADVARFTFAGEALLMVWLLWRGSRSPASGRHETTIRDDSLEASATGSSA
ncbi:DUF4386 domain-containing protein [Actinocorallia sp. B10E7]|uniref:DUF4386 domain-containing protein n=1 Tax=Actinocorallia sp. B10E7 TaxID=3153558 RepID=UPI00325EA319